MFRCLVGFALLIGGLLPSVGVRRTAFAQDAKQPAVATVAVSESSIGMLAEKAASSKDLSDDQKTVVKQLCQQARESLESAKQHTAKADEFQRMTDGAAEAKKSYQEQLDALADDVELENLPDVSLAELERILDKKTLILAEAKVRLNELIAEPTRRRTRHAEIPDLRQALTAKLDELSASLAAKPVDAEPAELSQARQFVFQAQHLAVAEEIRELDNELDAYTATDNMLSVQRDLAARQSSLAKQRVDATNQVVTERRRQEAAKDMRLADMDVQLVPESLQPLAMANQQFAERNSQVVELIEKSTRIHDSRVAELESLATRAKKTIKQVEEIGADGPVGTLLRTQRVNLPDVATIRRDRQVRKKELRDLQLDLMNLDEDSVELADLDLAVQGHRLALPKVVGDLSEDDLVAELRLLLERRKTQLDNLIGNLNNRFQLLVGTDTVERKLIDETTAFGAYIDERVLWLRSHDLISFDDVTTMNATMRRLLDPRVWKVAIDAIFEDIWEHPISYGVFLVGFAILVIFRQKLKAIVQRLGTSAMGDGFTRISPTLSAFAATLLISGAFPVLLWFLSWRLSSSAVASQIGTSAGEGLAAAALFLFPLAFLWQSVRENGLGVAHFRWSESACQEIRVHTIWFSCLCTPLVFGMGAMRAEQNASGQNSAGRISLCIVFLLTALYAHLMLRKDGPYEQNLISLRALPWRFYLRRFSYGLLVLPPLLFVALAVAGFYFTAFQLGQRFLGTIVWLMGVFLISLLMRRWLFLNQRMMAMRQAEEHLDEVSQHRASVEAEETPEVEESDIDLTSISCQSRRFLQMFTVLGGVFVIWTQWHDITPALGVIQNHELWSVAYGAEIDSITIQDVTLAVITLLVTLVALRNLPGLLELFVLQRLPMDAGARFATTTLTRYVITILGLAVAFRMAGIRWGQYQWVVAAATVGLGFGLQEIFANFVSGLIVLFERPVRVGDIITIQGVTGVVTRIQTRATTVTNWDRQEFVVPNKELVTGTLLNWTLSHSTNRLVLNVLVAIGTDIDKVKEILLSVARDNPSVMEDPGPLANFDTITNNTLSFVLRCYLPTMDNRISTTHELYAEIQRRMREAGIEFAAPQQDVRILNQDPNSLFAE